MRNRKVILVIPLTLLLMAASCSDRSIDNAIKATATVAATNRAASDLADAELAAGRLDKATRDAATAIFKEVANLDDSVMNTLEQAKKAGFLSESGRGAIVDSINLMRQRIAAGAFPFIKNEQSRVSISTKIGDLTTGLENILKVLPAAGGRP